MGISISAMKTDDFDEVAALWRATDGIGLHADVDSREGITAFLARNPGTSQVARHDGRMVGAVLCGHDGRRGYLHHLAVAVPWRKKGVGRTLVAACLAALAFLGIPKCNIFLYADNEVGAAFWQNTGWNERADLKVLQRPCSPCSLGAAQ
jgi:N-acetylglutamate synthase